MKKILLAAMIAALLILPARGLPLGADSETGIPALSQQKYSPGSAPAQIDTAQSMTPAIHAAVLALLHHDLSVFDLSNPDLGWETLYNMLSLYGQLDERSEYLGEDLILQSESVTDFSAALFPGLDSLGLLPDGLADRMVYSPELDSYRLVCGSDSLAQISIASLLPSGHNLELIGSLVYLVDESDLASFRATLAPADNLFGYTIVALELL